MIIDSYRSWGSDVADNKSSGSVFQHIPVLPDAVLHYLAPKPGGVYLDGTVGGGGHAEMILKASAPDGRLYGFDRDQRALEIAHDNLKSFSDRIRLIQDDFKSFDNHLPEIDLDGALLDLGVSSFQLDDPEAGFSFRDSGPLDMRMDRRNELTAEHLVNNLPEEELSRIIKSFGEERYSRRISRAIVSARTQEKISTTEQLADLIRRAVPRNRGKEKIDPATRTFQAIRIAVNDELNGLDDAVKRMISRIKPGGRMVVISFHSLEDRIVKWVFRELAGKLPPKGPPDLPIDLDVQARSVKIMTVKPVTAGKEEVDTNPRSRSAKLRAVEKL